LSPLVLKPKEPESITTLPFCTQLQLAISLMVALAGVQVPLSIISRLSSTANFSANSCGSSAPKISESPLISSISCV
jgi:hypothetical protein